MKKSASGRAPDCAQLCFCALLAFFFSSPSFAQNSPPDSDVFSAATSSTSFAFEFEHGFIIVPVSIHGSRPLRLVLDSGSARTLIDRNVAAALQLKEGAASSLQGAGQGRTPIYSLGNIDFHLPGLDTQGYEAFTVDLSPVSKAAGIQEDGILGYNFFARFAVEINFESKQMTITRPGAFRVPPSFQQLPLEIRAKWPYVKGVLTFPGPIAQEDSFFIDSGSSDAVDHPIVKTLDTKRSARTGVGFGAPVEGALAVATSFQLGPFVIEKPTVACCGGTEATSRMIGTEILRRFTVIFDYSASRLFIRPNHSLHAPHDAGAQN
jgi:hypothetical protein